MSKDYWVYILANIRDQRPVLYIGVTNNLTKRVAEHRLRRTGFTARYTITTLVYLATYPYGNGSRNDAQRLESAA
jgi:predicted GIY-YIG superfamily endonuclease